MKKHPENFKKPILRLPFIFKIFSEESERKERGLIIVYYNIIMSSIIFIEV